MKILITGHKGFIGQNMTKALSDHTLSFYEPGDHLPEVNGLDWVIHLGAITSTTETNVELVMQHNYDFSRWIANECKVHKVNLQYSSSASVYGLNRNFNESAPSDPRSPYAWSKFLFDRYIAHLAADWGIRVQGFRYFNVHGPHEDHKGNQASPHHKFEKQAKETGIIKLFEGSENYFRDFVPVETVCNVHKRFLYIKETGIWNLGTGNPVSFESVAQTIAKKYDAKIEYIPMPEEMKNQYQTYTCADLELLKRYISI
jgi:ADP-L-glycero-D-manno-heptose 6-epimerase